MIWLVGNRGMLGTEVQAAFEDASIEYIGTDREVDITRQEVVGEFFGQRSIDWIVNCAAYTAVDQAEDEPEAAFAVNSEAVANLSSAAADHGARMLHISTDYIFDGRKRTPYLPDDPPNPQSVYGGSKLAGEEALRENLADHVIVRTSWLYGKNGKNFVSTMLRLMEEKDEIGVVSDQIGCPTWARDLAGAIVRIVSAEKPDYGTFHYCNSGPMSWWDFAQEIFRQSREMGLLTHPCRIQALTTDQYPTKAPRPEYSVLDTSKIERHYALKVPSATGSLRTYLTQLASREKGNL
jgi:dTDP-4-dehydrorhamnose reductase